MLQILKLFTLYIISDWIGFRCTTKLFQAYSYIIIVKIYSPTMLLINEYYVKIIKKKSNLVHYIHIGKLFEFNTSYSIFYEQYFALFSSLPSGTLLLK